MKGQTHDSHQLALLDASIEPQHHPLADDSAMSDASPPAGKREPLRQRNRKAYGASLTPSPPPPSHRAPRGDLFRELAESIWAAPENTQPTPEQLREANYRKMSSSVGTSIYRRKRRLKGPIEKLRRQVGSNRYCEFAQWLNRIRDIKGASVPVRYSSMLAIVGRQIDSIAIEFRYTLNNFDNSTQYDQTNARDHLDTARALLHQARHDIAELQPLFVEMMHLNARLGRAKQAAALPVVPIPERVLPTAEEMRALRENLAQAERDARVAESRKWVSEMSGKKLGDDDVRRGGRWLTMYCAVELVRDDLKGFAGHKPLWSEFPTVEQLAEDYQISKRDSRRVLAASRGET